MGTLTASAYLNATSPTGRTLMMDIAGDSIDHPGIHSAIRMQDGCWFQIYESWIPNSRVTCSAADAWKFYHSSHATSLGETVYADDYFPIPEDWVAGSYEIVSVDLSQGTFSDNFENSSSVINSPYFLPDLPGFVITNFS